jgi:hypothetical protein
MSNVEGERRLKAAGLMHAKRMIETILEGWDLLTWNELLADDVALSVRLGTVDLNRTGDLHGLCADLQVTGRDEVKRVLRGIYSDLRKGLLVTTEVISGYDAVLVGNLSVQKPDVRIESVPMGIYMAFNSKGKIRKMTLADVDLQPLTDAIRNAAEVGAATSQWEDSDVHSSKYE